MNPEDRLTELLRSRADSYQPADGREVIRHRARTIRRVRTARRIAVPIVAAGIIAGFAIAASNSGPSRHFTVNMPPPSTTSPQGPRTTAPLTTETTAPRTTTTTPTTSTTTSPAVANRALAGYLAAHPDAVSHSGVVYEGVRPIGAVGLEPNPVSRSVAILDLSSTSANVLAQLALPAPYYDLVHVAVQAADVTGDGRPDFLVTVSAADNNPGVVVSDDGGSWRLVPLVPTAGAAVDPANVYIGRSPSISGAWVQSSYNDCIPYCAAGHTSTLTWLYDRNGGYFKSVPTSALLQPGYYRDGTAGTPHYDLIVEPGGGSYSGWLFFIYQDGRVSVLFHYTAAPRGDGTLVLTTDTSSQPFPFTYEPPGAGQAGSTPIGRGQSYAGTYAAGSLTLSSCSSYLYFANSPQSCTFNYSGASAR